MNTAPTALIADDEDLPRAELRRMLAIAWPELQVVAECEDGPAAVEALETQAPQIAFLDIRMPGMNGLDVARAASGRCHTVFTTAYDSHAVAAFDAGAVDYLLKPVNAERLAQAVQRLQQRLRSAAPVPDIDTLLQRLAGRLQGGAAADVGGPPRLRWLSASVGDTIKMFAIDEVLFFQSDEKYTRVVTASDEAHVRKPLREIADGPRHMLTATEHEILAHAPATRCLRRAPRQQGADRGRRHARPGLQRAHGVPQAERGRLRHQPQAPQRRGRVRAERRPAAPGGRRAAGQHQQQGPAHACGHGAGHAARQRPAAGGRCAKAPSPASCTSAACTPSS